MDKTFSMKEVLALGWNAFKSRVGFFLLLLVVLALCTVVPQALMERMQAPVLSVILGIAMQLFQWFLIIGLLKISLQFVDNQESKLGDLFSGADRFLPYVLATILYGLMGLVGLILLIVPGIIVLIMFGFYSYLIVDKGMGPVVALKASMAVTKGARWRLFLFGLVIGLLNMAGALLFMVGLFVTIPMTLVATAHVYRQLLSQTEDLPSA
jgi:uncharacterized membrane protein